MAKDFGVCRICGAHGPLTFEHVPPKAAGNEPLARGLDIQQYFSELRAGRRPVLEDMRAQKLPRGSGGYYLCKYCNNYTGGKYGTDYAGWAIQGNFYRDQISKENDLKIPFYIFPSRIFKQILSIFACTCGEGLFESEPLFRKLVLDAESRGVPDVVKVYLYFLSKDSPYSRQTGIVGMIQERENYIFAEFSYPPFGYLMTLDGSASPDVGLLDITAFSFHQHNDFRDLFLSIPIRGNYDHYPANFLKKEK